MREKKNNGGRERVSKIVGGSERLFFFFFWPRTGRYVTASTHVKKRTRSVVSKSRQCDGTEAWVEDH